MKESKDILDRIRGVLNLSSEKEEVKVELATAELEDGTIIEAESFEVGAAIFVVSEEERVPMPEGEFFAEGVGVIVVSEEGVIAEIKEKEAEQEEEAEESAEELSKESVSIEDFNALKSSFEELRDKINLALEPKEEEKVEVKASKEIKHSPEKDAKKSNLSKLNAINTIDRVAQWINK
jgi:hypothetical protein